ncbi:MAG: ABC transporter permease subunit [Oscillatoriaceae bacterium SKW80]|nr:ABC transporter permease subunit [Oscillatoriaceae bacterium SKYG93]MCX8119220.1 ABC transporter permease subunit [Oscillatoriaceae bacterium SKW80]MDW8454687.1 ABC transporter permease subunit [Oscillatoriaceae cyanobacterium SKYGB_i_bin93]HIK28531.1 ABC transporter permease subunit [Oscillatoriaceae cyanobacterium M7585_C2015_266]
MKRERKIPLWRDIRFWRWGGQVLTVMLVASAFGILWDNLTFNLKQLGIELGFDFLQSQASFDIGETPIPYQPFDSYTRALLVGLLNSLRVILLALLLSTVVGVTIGIARLWDNWLVRQLALIYVEIFRNIPLLLQLFFWYFALFLNLPPADNKISLLGLIYASNRGVDIGEIHLSSEFSALLMGMIIYNGAYIAEIVRGGIQSVPPGQWEAAKALGLTPGLTMRLVILPQALRVIIPPLTNQYLNLVKGSSLAIAIGYPDIYFVASTTFNQTGRAVEVMLLIAITYLILDLIVSLVMNTINRAVQIKER